MKKAFMQYCLLIADYAHARESEPCSQARLFHNGPGGESEDFFYICFVRSFKVVLLQAYDEFWEGCYN